MSSILKKLESQGLIKPPSFVSGGCQYEVKMGSFAYGVSNETSDIDIYGFCIPPKNMVFPHLDGEIEGFGRQKKRFEQFQQHHVKSKDGKKEYDFSIYSIVKYFQLCMENNPNLVDSLFVPQRCIVHSTKIGNMLRENRKLFLHKGSWYKFKGYSYSQLNKCRSKGLKRLVDFCKEDGLNPRELNRNRVSDEISFRKRNNISGYVELENTRIDRLDELLTILTDLPKDFSNSNRLDMIEKYGWDVKFGYHVVRLLDEVEQILTEGDIDLERNREQLKSIRRGEWTIEKVTEYFERKEKELESLYTSSKLQHSPDENKIKQLLLDCLEEYYGNLESCVVRPNQAIQALRDIQKIIERSNIQ